MRAPLPPQGSEPWFPSRELLEALDRPDAIDLSGRLSCARRARLGSLLDAALAVLWATALVGSLVEEAAFNSGFYVLWVASCVLLSVLSASRAHGDHVYAKLLRDEAYQLAERALEAKLARDDRAAILQRLVVGLDGQPLIKEPRR